MDYVILTGGKQYLISPGKKITVEKLPVAAGVNVVFDKILMAIDSDKVQIGNPYLTGQTLTASVVAEGKSKKKIVFRYHSKTRYRKRKGHRQPYSEIIVQ